MRAWIASSPHLCLPGSSPAGPTRSMSKGIVADQLALHGLLAKVWDLGLPLLLVECVAAQERCPDEP